MEKTRLKDVILITLIISLAIFVRSIPVITNYAWGGDLGIYYGIALRMAEKNEIFVDYNGWGGSYQYFPMLYLISLSINLLTGFDLIQVMIRIAPVIGGLTVFVLYLIVIELTKNKRLALISSALLAVAPFHVYQTSHAAPLTVGHMFMLTSIFFFLRYERDKKYIFPLLISTIFLILSHHMTTYFYLITIAGMIIWRNFKYEIDRKENLYSFGYLFIASILTFSYWRFVAKPVYFSFMKSGLGLESWQVILSYFILIIVSFGLTKILRKKKLSNILSELTARWEKGSSKVFLISFIFILFIELIFLFFKIPATNIKMNMMAILLSIPIVAFASLSISGIPFLSRDKGMSYFQGWLIVISLSLFYALITRNTTIYPDRHIEYLMIPMCIPASMSILKAKKSIVFNIKILRRSISRFKDITTISLTILLVLSNSTIVYPARDSFNNLNESISEVCFSALEWLKNNTSGKDTIATDLRLSNLIWAYGMNATFNETNKTWTSIRWEDCVEELYGEGKNYSRISYILIDDVMREKVICLGVFLSVYMTNESYEKFLREPFELVYRKASLDKMDNEINWVEIYRVNWSYIEESKTL